MILFASRMPGRIKHFAYLQSAAAETYLASVAYDHNNNNNNNNNHNNNN